MQGRATRLPPNRHSAAAEAAAGAAYRLGMSDYSAAFSRTHDSPEGPVTCATCGCRLEAASGADDGAWRHFASLSAGQDARGCRPHCVDALHDSDGLVMLDAAAA